MSHEDSTMPTQSTGPAASNAGPVGWVPAANHGQPTDGQPTTNPDGTAPALRQPRWSGKKTAVVAALAIGLSSAGALGAAAATPLRQGGSDSGPGGHGGFNQGGFGGPGGQVGQQGTTNQEGTTSQQGSSATTPTSMPTTVPTGEGAAPTGAPGGAGGEAPGGVAPGGAGGAAPGGAAPGAAGAAGVAS